MFYGSEIKTMMPKLKSDNYEGLELIRPLYLIKESDIISWKTYNELVFLNCACSFTTKDAQEKISKRREMKELIKDLRKVNKDIDYNIFKSLDNVNLNCVLGTTTNGIHKSFLEDYEKTRAQIQWQLIKEKVARNYDIKVEEEDMLRLARFYAAQQFAQYGMSNLPEDVIEKYAQELLKKDDVKSDIQNRAFEDKVYAAIQDAVGIDEKTVSVEDFNKLFEAAK